ncbi:hypothetical protein B0T09DRAFT_63718 [Sordaria sp. MPI-SDFR-AT-0083]|nr:hypothetical protein B0T09DRAFT_63718 [Sordaria sp. MPI-SDFR-AT-0083]
MKIFTFLFFADIVQITTCDGAFHAALKLNTSTPQTLRYRRGPFSARQRHLTTRHLHDALSEVFKESSLPSAIQIARDTSRAPLASVSDNLHNKEGR